MTPLFYEVVIIVVCGAFVAAFLVSLLPLSGRVRKVLIGVGPFGAVIGVLVKNPQGLDGIAWTAFAFYGVLAWFVGLALGYLLHRLFQPRPRSGESTWAAFVKLITLR